MRPVIWCGAFMLLILLSGICCTVLGSLYLRGYLNHWRHAQCPSVECRYLNESCYNDCIDSSGYPEGCTPYYYDCGYYEVVFQLVYKDLAYNFTINNYACDGSRRCKYNTKNPGGTLRSTDENLTPGQASGTILIATGAIMIFSTLIVGAFVVYVKCDKKKRQEASVHGHRSAYRA